LRATTTHRWDGKQGLPEFMGLKTEYWGSAEVQDPPDLEFLFTIFSLQIIILTIHAASYKHHMNIFVCAGYRSQQYVLLKITSKDDVFYSSAMTKCIVISGRILN
jgi:hypothetical protein